MKWIERFWSYVDIKGENECWLWKGGITTNGYGQFRIGNKKVRPHRIILEMYEGELKDGEQALHHCDVKLCCNPLHLYKGTCLDNMKDKVEKGRQARGETYGNTKLTENDVVSIRELISDGYSNNEIASIFDVHFSAIWKIKRGYTWGWLDA
jgi:hypothetical protein